MSRDSRAWRREPGPPRARRREPAAPGRGAV